MVFSCEGFTELAGHLCDQDEVGSELLELMEESEEALTLLADLINQGYWFPA